MSDTNDSVLLRPGTVGMEMEPPYSVYLDGAVVATFSTEQEACELFNKLAGREVPNMAAR